MAMAMAAASSILRRVSSQLTRIPISSSSSIESYLLPPRNNSPCLPEYPEEDPSIDLMAVPKKKTSKYKKRLRNGPKALKPIPVIVKCKACGKVKLPHFYCCSGERGIGSSAPST